MVEEAASAHTSAIGSVEEDILRGQQFFVELNNKHQLTDCPGFSKWKNGFIIWTPYVARVHISPQNFDKKRPNTVQITKNLRNNGKEDK